LSRWPILEWRIYNRPPLTQAVLETKLAVPGENLTTYNVHFLPTLLLPFEIRRWQAVGKLLQVIRARQPGPHLILGDLNAIAPGDRVLQHQNPARMRRIMALQFNYIPRLALPRLLKAGYVDCFRRLHPGVDGFTWMPGNRTTRYDYILANPAIAPKLHSCRVVAEIEAVCTASDHFPLMAEFILEGAV
jgi:exonuclease III